MKLSFTIFILAFILIVYCFTMAYKIYINEILKREEKELFKNLKTTNHNYKVVVSLTTSPSRINTLEKTLNTILNQSYPPYIIRINIPKIFKRTGEIYSIPSFIKDNPKIKIYEYDEDYGPIMKILPTIMDYKNHTNVSIIYTDDDVIMLPKTIETFLKLEDKYPEYTLCLSGFQFNGKNRWNRNNTECFVNVAEGYMCVYLNKNVLGRIRYSLMDYYKMISKNEYCFTSDDLMMGNFYAMNGIFVYKIQTDEVNYNLWWNSGCELPYGKDGDGISSLASDQHFTRYNNAYDYLKHQNINFLNVQNI